MSAYRQPGRTPEPPVDRDRELEEFETKLRSHKLRYETLSYWAHVFLIGAGVLVAVFAFVAFIAYNIQQESECSDKGGVRIRGECLKRVQ